MLILMGDHTYSWYLALLRTQLAMINLSIDPARSEQLIVGSLSISPSSAGNNPALIQHQDLVGLADGAQALRNDE